MTFLYGCVATFLGVFIIAWAPPLADHDEGRTEQDDGRSPTSESIFEHGILGRKRATLVLPKGVKDSPAIRHQHSLNLIGLSPAQASNSIHQNILLTGMFHQHILLVHTPPRDVPVQFRDRERDRDVERELRTPDSVGRRRTMSLFAENPQGSSGPSRTRESSVGGRPRKSMGARFGSVDQGSLSNTSA